MFRQFTIYRCLEYHTYEELRLKLRKFRFRWIEEYHTYEELRRFPPFLVRFL